jgi:O-antigen/teichoic acid export membrane protein
MRQSRITTNFLLNVAGTIVPLATALITIPIYIAHIGAARYGILSVAWILLGYLGFLDLGLSRASINALSRLSHGSAAERAAVLVTALYMNLLLGLVGGLVIYAASGFLLARFANLTPDLAAEAQAAIPWIACMLPVALVSGIGSGAIESRERFLAVNIFQTCGGVVGQVAPVVCAVLIGPSLTVVIPAAFFARLLSTALIWVFVMWTERPINLRRFDRRKLREMLGFGAWVSVSSGINPLLETFDQLLIGALLGPASIAHYSVPMTIATRSQVVAMALARTLFPRLSRLAPKDARLLASRAVVTLAFGFGALCGPAIVLVGPFLRLWIGEEFASYATPVAKILLIGAWANGLAFMPYALLQGQGRPDLAAKIHIAEIFPFLGGLYFLIIHFGLPGAALAWTLRTVIDCFVMLWIGRCWTIHLLRALPAVSLVGGCWLIARLLPSSLMLSATSAAIVGLAFVASGIALDSAWRELVRPLLPVGKRLWARIG